MAATLEGKLLDERYLVLGRVGAGAFGEVYRAEQRAFGVALRKVALKIFKEPNLSKERAREVFGDAITLANLIDECRDVEIKQHFIGVYDIGMLFDLDNRGYVAMELAPGNLAQELRPSAPLPLKTVISYAHQIAEALAFMHTREPPVIHRDLKPDNILICPPQHLQLADFGLATQIDPLLRSAPAAGALSYQAPESLLLSECSPSTDVYSLGLILYEMLTGVHPFTEVGSHLSPHEDGQGSLVRLHSESRRRPIRCPSEFDVELIKYPLLEELVMQCLEYYPHRRPASAEDVLKGIDAMEAGKRSPGLVLPTPHDEVQALVSNSESYLRQGNKALAESRAQEAYECLTRIPASGSLADCWLKIVAILVNCGATSEAKKIADEGIRKCPCAQTYSAAATAYRAIGAYKLAEEFDNRAREGKGGS